MSVQDTTYETYYVPHNSKLPIFASMGIFLTLFGIGNILNAMAAEESRSLGVWILLFGGLIMGTTLFYWFKQVIEENHKRLYSDQLNRSFVWGMSWFIFSEVMFFAAFFGALFYIRFYNVDWLAGIGDRGPTDMLWPGYEATWPMMQNPDPAEYPGPMELISPWGLPLVNTILLVTSSFTITFAHHGLNAGHRNKLTMWLAITILLGLTFLVVQGYEYYHAYADLGLTLSSGIYGTTFFMLTGFHGAHVTLGTFMLIVMFGRVLKGHFSADDQFGFEATAWYWHFVDVVWLGLFVFVYVLGS